MLSSSVVHIIDLIRLYQKTRQVKGKKFNTEIACAYVNLAIEKHGSKLIFGGACDLFVCLAWLLYKSIFHMSLLPLHQDYQFGTHYPTSTGFDSISQEATPVAWESVLV